MKTAAPQLIADEAPEKAKVVDLMQALEDSLASARALNEAASLMGEKGLLPEDLRPMTAEEVAWCRAQRSEGLDPDNVEEESCRVPGAAAKGICAYAGDDGKSACGAKCIWRDGGEVTDGK